MRELASMFVGVTAVSYLALSMLPARAGDDLSRDDPVAACRFAASEGGFPQYASAPATVSETRSGEPWVFLGALDCTFAPTGELARVFIGGCYECGIMYDDDLIARINQRLLRLQPPTP